VFGTSTKKEQGPDLIRLRSSSRRSAPCRVWFATTRYLCMTTTTSNLFRPRTALEIERRLRQFPVPASPGYSGLSVSPRRFGAGLGQNARGAGPNLCQLVSGAADPGLRPFRRIPAPTTRVPDPPARRPASRRPPDRPRLPGAAIRPVRAAGAVKAAPGQPRCEPYPCTHGWPPLLRHLVLLRQPALTGPLSTRRHRNPMTGSGPAPRRRKRSPRATHRRTG